MKTNWKIQNTVSNKTTGEITEVTYEYLSCCSSRTSVRTSSVIQLPANTNQEKFIPYESLTESIVIGWVKSILGEEVVTFIEEKSAIMFETLASHVTEEMIVGVPWRPLPSQQLIPTIGT